MAELAYKFEEDFVGVKNVRPPKSYSSLLPFEYDTNLPLLLTTDSQSEFSVRDENTGSYIFLSFVSKESYDNLPIRGNVWFDGYLRNIRNNEQKPAIGSIVYGKTLQGDVFGMSTMEDPRKTENLKLLDSFLTLDESEDEDGFVPFTQNHIKLVKGIISELQHQPEVFASARESIVFEYFKDGDRLIFEIESNAKVTMFQKLVSGYKVEKEILLQDVNREVECFYGRDRNM